MLWKLPNIFVDGKKLEGLLWMLSSAGVKLDGAPQPVVNAHQRSNGSLMAETSGRLPDMFEEHIRKRKLTKITPADVKEFCESVGRSRKSYSTILIELRKRGVLKPNGKTTFGRAYHVVPVRKGVKHGKA
jgi:hypothetical protein